MEIIQYEDPVSWTDKNMNWEDPDPGNIDYWRAIALAALERMLVIKNLDYSIDAIGNYNRILRQQISQYRPCGNINAMINTVRGLERYYIHLDRVTDPMFSRDDDRLLLSPPFSPEQYDLRNHPVVFYLPEDLKKIMKSMRSVINKCRYLSLSDLRATPNPNDYSISYDFTSPWRRGVATREETLQSAVDKAIAQAMSKPEGSGIPLFEPSMYNRVSVAVADTNPPKYNASATSRSYRLDLSASPLSRCNLICCLNTSKLGADAIFDTGSLRLEEGWSRVDYEWTKPMIVDFGDVDFFPKYPNYPAAGEYTWIGFETDILAYVDLGCPGGFKFTEL